MSEVTAEYFDPFGFRDLTCISIWSVCGKVLAIRLIYTSRIDKIIKNLHEIMPQRSTEVSLAVKKNDSFLSNGFKTTNKHFKFALIFLRKLL